MESRALPVIVRPADLKALGLSRYRLNELVRTGDYEQVAPGFYVRAGEMDDTTAAWASISHRNESATICLTSALSLHDLTDEIPRMSDIAVPRGDRTLAVKFAPIRWHSFDRATFGLGRGQHQLVEDISIGLYSAERTITDLFRLRHELGSEIPTEALKRWIRRRSSSPAALLKMASSFPMALPALRSTLEILL